MDAFEQQLLTQPSAAPVAPEMLEILGRQAASLFLEKGVPLNDAVTQLVAAQPSLNNEHVRRIVEFANTTAFQQMFQQGNDKNVHFDVADPGVIIRDMKDGGSPAQAGKTLSEGGGKKDFGTPPLQVDDGIGDAALTQLFATGQESTNSAPMAKVAFVDQAIGYGVGRHKGKQQKERGEAHSFGSKQVASLLLPGGLGYQLGRAHAHEAEEKKEKTASEEMMEVPHASHADPVDDVFDSYVNLRAARDELITRKDTAETLLKTAQEDLYRAVKNEVMRHNGSGLGGVLGALEKVASQDKIAEVLPGMVRRLLGEGVHPQSLERSMTKTAGMVVNRNHPLVTAWELMEKSAEEFAICDIAIEEATKSIEEQSKFLRSVH